MKAVADYYTPERLAQKLGISEGILAELETKGLLQPRFKGERRFFSCRQAYELQLALRLTRKKKLSLDQAFLRVEELRLRQASPVER